MAVNGKIKKPAERRMVRVAYLTEGATLSGVTFDENGFFLYPAYTIFTHQIIESLKNRNIHRIFYTPAPEDDKDHLFRDRSKGLILMLSDAVDKMGRPDFFSVRHMVNDLYDFFSSSHWEIIDLLVPKDGNDYLFTHAFNVGIMTMSLAYRQGMDKQAVVEAGMGGFLHDIGKFSIPRHLLTKDDLSNDEFSQIQTHTRKGAEFLARFGELAPGVLKIVHQHHEWYNGKGYPAGIRDDKLDTGARLAAICDVYDALTSHTGYRDARTAREAVAIIMCAARTQFSPVLVSRFVREIIPLIIDKHLFPVGSLVLLNTGEIARVVELHSERDLLPVVKIIYDNRKEPVRRSIHVDLTKDGSRSILSLVEEKDGSP